MSSFIQHQFSLAQDPLQNNYPSIAQYEKSTNKIRLFESSLSVSQSVSYMLFKMGKKRTCSFKELMLRIYSHKPSCLNYSPKFFKLFLRESIFVRSVCTLYHMKLWRKIAQRTITPKLLL